jgi:hypothetical protein
MLRSNSSGSWLGAGSTSNIRANCVTNMRSSSNASRRPAQLKGPVENGKTTSQNVSDTLGGGKDKDMPTSAFVEGIFLLWAKPSLGSPSVGLRREVSLVVHDCPLWNADMYAFRYILSGNGYTAFLDNPLRFRRDDRPDALGFVDDGVQNRQFWKLGDVDLLAAPPFGLVLEHLHDMRVTRQILHYEGET